MVGGAGGRGGLGLQCRVRCKRAVSCQGNGLEEGGVFGICLRRIFGSRKGEAPVGRKVSKGAGSSPNRRVSGVRLSIHLQTFQPTPPVVCEGLSESPCPFSTPALPGLDFSHQRKSLKMTDTLVGARTNAPCHALSNQNTTLHAGIRTQTPTMVSFFLLLLLHKSISPASLLGL